MGNGDTTCLNNSKRGKQGAVRARLPYSLLSWTPSKGNFAPPMPTELVSSPWLENIWSSPAHRTCSSPILACGSSVPHLNLSHACPHSSLECIPTHSRAPALSFSCVIPQTWSHSCELTRVKYSQDSPRPFHMQTHACTTCRNAHPCPGTQPLSPPCSLQSWAMETLY